MTVLSCQDVRERAGAWIDGEEHGAAAAAVATHAASCAGCAAAIEQQRVTRAVVGRHAAELRGVAPAGLRAAVERELRGAKGAVARFPTRPAPRRLSSVVARWSVAAALVLAVGGVFVVGGAGGSRLYAAQLALDHYKCLLIDGGHAHAAKDVLETSWRAERGWPIDVPPTEPALGITLVGLRRCIASEGQMAHVLYEVGGARLSLFIVPEPVDGAAADLPIMGVDTRSWTRDGRTYSLVGAAVTTSEPVVEFMKAHAH